ncbi:hypothetical protein LIER_22996 [Lithospermum erythrorhizon]|uniref:VQ domain-containing protein n=1 Tax=Lithospermum erythrorhizon TaxID=34254 RepID=A0AAV3QX41_LITER
MFNMERDMIKNQLSLPNSTKSSSTLGLPQNSQTISKVKPKIRIIHIFAPEIIKTDVSNFKELVQRLTGKPPEVCKTLKRRKNDPLKEKMVPMDMDTTGKTSNCNEQKNAFQTCNEGSKYGLHSQELRERIKGEEEIWRGANSGGGFLGNFPEFDGGFMAEINGFQFLPLDASSLMDGYGEPQLIA